MDSTSTNSASRRSTRKRIARKHSYSPQPPPYRKKASDPPSDEGSLMRKKQRDQEEYERSQENIEVQQKKFKKTIKRESETAVFESENEDDSGTYDISSVSEVEDSDDRPPQLYSVNESKSDVFERESSMEVIMPSTMKSQGYKQAIAQSSSEDSFVERYNQKVQKEAAAAKLVQSTEKAQRNVSLYNESQDSHCIRARSLAVLKELNPELFNSALKKPLQDDDTLIVVIKLLERSSTPFTSDTVVSFLQDAENVSRKFIKDLPPSLQKPRICLEKAWEAVAVTYGLFGPTVVPLILHFIKQQNILETKYFNRPAALFAYTLIVVKYFHEHIMSLLSTQISVTHNWILDILEQPFLRSYITLVQWLKYFEPRLAQLFITDPSVETFKPITNFMDQFVYDPYSAFLTDLKNNPLISSNKVVILLRLQSLKDDKLSLVALLIRGLDNIGCEIRPYLSENGIIQQYESIKANNPKSFVFSSEVSLQQTHFSPSFGSICFSSKFTIQSLEPPKSGHPTKLHLSATNSDGKTLNEDTLVNNNITPACICRYYLEHITKFIESFIKEEKQK
uniref:Uncharacterized protein n=1 Tax=Panagrolaimus sp. ES5 TaxID=591445 RepID=A0AC34GQ43_9BILA